MILQDVFQRKIGNRQQQQKKNMNENVINEKTTKEIQIEKHDNNDVYQTKKTLVFFWKNLKEMKKWVCFFGSAISLNDDDDILNNPEKEMFHFFECRICLFVCLLEKKYFPIHSECYIIIIIKPTHHQHHHWMKWKNYQNQNCLWKFFIYEKKTYTTYTAWGRIYNQNNNEKKSFQKCLMLLCLWQFFFVDQHTHHHQCILIRNSLCSLCIFWKQFLSFFGSIFFFLLPIYRTFNMFFFRICSVLILVFLFCFVFLGFAFIIMESKKHLKSLKMGVYFDCKSFPLSRFLSVCGNL